MTTVADCARRRAPDARPQQILDAALAVLGEQGLAGARLDDIARRAGIAKGTIYLYFPNKDALFREVVRQTLVARLEAMAAAMRATLAAAPDAPAEAQLREYLATWWEALRTPEIRTIYRLVIGELHHFPELLDFYLREVVARGMALLGGVVERGIARGEFRPVEPRVAARLVASTLIAHSLWVDRPGAPDVGLVPLSPAAALAQIEDFALHALRPAAVAAPPAV